VKLLRSAAAVAGGLAVVVSALLWLAPLAARTFGVEGFESFSMPLLLAGLSYSVLGAMVGGYITALIAGRRELPHGAALGILIVALALWSMRRRGEIRPGWQEMTLAGCGPVAAIFGSALRMMQNRTRNKGKQVTKSPEAL